MENEGIPVLCLNLKHPFRLGQIKTNISRIIRFARAHNVCLIHTHLTAAGLYGGLAAKIMGVPSLATIHGSLPVRKGFKKGLLFLEIATRNLFRTVVGVSRHGVQEIRRYALWQRGRCIKHIYNGINISFWRKASPETVNEEVSLPLGGRDIRISMVANFFKEKDHRTAIRAYQLFSRKYQKSVLTLSGEGDERKKVEDLVQALQLENVKFAGEVEDIREVLEETDLFILASLSEGISIAVLEAMAMEIPVIASDVGGMAEIITHGVDGILVPKEDPEFMFRAMDDLVKNPAKREAIARKARETVVKLFSLEAMTREYLDLYRRLSSQVKPI